MLNFFNSLQNRNRGIPAMPAWQYVKDGLSREIDNVIKAYRNSAYAVGSDHALAKILHGFATSTDYDVNTYYRKVDAQALNLAQQLGYTTVNSQGRVFTGVFFAKGSKEVIIAHDTEFDPVDMTDNWMDVNPVQVLRHGFDQLDFFPYNGTVKSSKINVFAINFPLLAVQYRAYRQWQKNGGQAEDTGQNSMYHFIYSYVLNNMHYHSIPLAIMNRLMKISAGKKPNRNTFRHPFMVTDYSDRVDMVLNSYYETIASGNVDMAWILNYCPMPEWISGLELMRLPDIYASRQVNWACYMARMNVLTFLTDVNLDVLQRTNRAELNRIKYMLGVYLRDNTIRQAVPPDMYYREELAIKSLLDKM